MKQGELLARISAQLRVKADATWVQSIVKGVLEDDSEAMNILQTILPEPIISRIQVKLLSPLMLCQYGTAGVCCGFLSVVACVSCRSGVMSCVMCLICTMRERPVLLTVQVCQAVQHTY